jgi:transaldolase
MKAAKELHDPGQSLWLDKLTRDLLDNGTLKRCIDELSGSRRALHCRKFSKKIGVQVYGIRGKS